MAELTREQIMEICAAKDPAELVARAAEKGVNLSEEQAEHVLGMLGEGRALSDEELAGVSGGGFWGSLWDGICAFFYGIGCA